MILHVQNTQISKVNNPHFFQMFFFPTKCAPFFLKIGEYFNIDDYKIKRIKIIFITNFRTFGSNVLLTLKIWF
jgi:hypothetical protein